MIDKCYEGISPLSFIPLEEKEAKKQVLEEEARQNATSTTIANYKNKKKYTPIIRLKNKALRIILKNFTYVGQNIFRKYFPYFTLISKTEAEVKYNIA